MTTLWTDTEWFERWVDKRLHEEGFGVIGLLLTGWINGKPQFEREPTPEEWERLQRIATGEDVPEADFGNITENVADTAKPRKRGGRK